MARWNYNLKQRPCRSSSAIIQDKAQSEIGSRQLSKRLLGMDIQFVKCPVDRLADLCLGNGIIQFLGFIGLHR